MNNLVAEILEDVYVHVYDPSNANLLSDLSSAKLTPLFHEDAEEIYPSWYAEATNYAQARAWVLCIESVSMQRGRIAPAAPAEISPTERLNLILAKVSQTARTAQRLKNVLAYLKDGGQSRHRLHVLMNVVEGSVSGYLKKLEAVHLVQCSSRIYQLTEKAKSLTRALVVLRIE